MPLKDNLLPVTDKLEETIKSLEETTLATAYNLFGFSLPNMHIGWMGAYSS